MGKYLILWEMDQSRIPTDPKERGNSYLILQDMVQKDMDKGLLKDWGVFTGSSKGYCVFEGTDLELGNLIQQYVPYVIFNSWSISSLDMVMQMAKNLT